MNSTPQPITPPLSTARQHGAMEFSDAPTCLDTLREYRLARVRDQLVEHDYAGIILYDQLNTRYATDVTNMQIWCSHNENRYVFIAAEGPVIVFEYGGKGFLAEGVHTVDEVRPALPWYYFGAGSRYRERAQKWADEIASLIREHGGGNRRLAIDRCGIAGIDALQRRGISVGEGFEVMEQARVIKSAEEIVLMRAAIAACETAMTNMRNSLRPGITENALYAKMHETNIALGGEWIETRLLASGPRTNPWFRESSMRRIEAGDIVSFDTDLVGPYGYCADISRTWRCGDGRPSDAQRRIYAQAVEQIAFNRDLIKAGVTARELADKAWPMPDDCVPNRYGCLFHGVGLCDEYPAVVHRMDFEDAGYDMTLEAGMTLCVESYIGPTGGREGVKLEEQVLVTQDGCEPLSTYPLEWDWL